MIYCSTNISSNKLDILLKTSEFSNNKDKDNLYNIHDLRSPKLIKCLKSSVDLFNNLMKGSFTKDSRSHIIQVLFLQQIKMTSVILFLAIQGFNIGKETLSRVAFENYIKIKWLLMDSYTSINRNKRFKKFVRHESLGLEKKISYIEKRINRIRKKISYCSDAHKWMRLRVILYDFNNLLRQAKQLLENEGISSTEANNIVKKLNNRTKKSPSKNRNNLTISYMSDTNNYNIYRKMCSEVHSNIINLFHIDTKYNGSREYISNLTIKGCHNSPEMISNLVIILVNSFCIMKYNHMFNCNKIKLINRIALNLRNYAIIFHNGVMESL